MAKKIALDRELAYLREKVVDLPLRQLLGIEADTGTRSVAASVRSLVSE